MSILKVDELQSRTSGNRITLPEVNNYPPYRNIIINGDMSIAQRGTSTSGVTTTDGYYACDRYLTRTDTGTWTISQSTDVPSGQGFVNSFKLECTSAGTANADEVLIRQQIEGLNCQFLKYGTANAESLTLSFWIKSNNTGIYSANVNNLNSTQNRLISFAFNVNSANTWEKKTITLPADTSGPSPDNDNSTGLQLQFIFGADLSRYGGGVSNTWTNYNDSNWAPANLTGLGGSTSDYVNITGVQLEVGDSATPFENLPYDVNLQRCQRYYQTISKMSGYTGSSTTYVQCSVPFPITMRGTPSLSQTFVFRFDDAASAITQSSTGLSTASLDNTGTILNVQNMSCNGTYRPHGKANTAKLEIDAEL